MQFGRGQTRIGPGLTLPQVGLGQDVASSGARWPGCTVSSRHRVALTPACGGAGQRPVPERGPDYSHLSTDTNPRPPTCAPATRQHGPGSTTAGIPPLSHSRCVSSSPRPGTCPRAAGTPRGTSQGEPPLPGCRPEAGTLACSARTRHRAQRGRPTREVPALPPQEKTDHRTLQMPRAKAPEPSRHRGPSAHEQAELRGGGKDFQKVAGGRCPVLSSGHGAHGHLGQWSGWPSRQRRDHWGYKVPVGRRYPGEPG